MKAEEKKHLTELEQELKKTEETINNLYRSYINATSNLKIYTEEFIRENIKAGNMSQETARDIKEKIVWWNTIAENNPGMIETSKELKERIISDIQEYKKQHSLFAKLFG